MSAGVTPRDERRDIFLGRRVGEERSRSADCAAMSPGVKAEVGVSDAEI